MLLKSLFWGLFWICKQELFREKREADEYSILLLLQAEKKKKKNTLLQHVL